MTEVKCTCDGSGTQWKWNFGRHVTARGMDSDRANMDADFDTSKPEDTMGQAKHWIVVINNPQPIDEAQLLMLQPKLTYSIVADETGAQGTPHLQCYLVFKNKMRFNSLKKLLPRAWLGIKKGTCKQASDYCKKDGKFVEFGHLPEEQTAKATRISAETWAQTKKLALEGNLEEITPQHFVQYYGTLVKIADDHADKSAPVDLIWENNLPPNEWIWGDTGTGKSYKARNENPGFYLKMNNKWWENYAGQDVVLIEDVGKTHEWMGDFLKIWGDRYTFRVEKKYRSAMIRPKKIIVTSNYHPIDLWPDMSVHGPILRRFKIEHRTETFIPEPQIIKPAVVVPMIDLTQLEESVEDKPQPSKFVEKIKEQNRLRREANKGKFPNAASQNAALKEASERVKTSVDKWFENRNTVFKPVYRRTESGPLFKLPKEEEELEEIHDAWESDSNEMIPDSPHRSSDDNEEM